MSLVLVIDIQERLTPVMSGAEELVANSLKFLQIAKELGIKIIATEQYPKGLGNTIDSLDGFIFILITDDLSLLLVIPSSSL